MKRFLPTPAVRLGKGELKAGGEGKHDQQTGGEPANGFHPKRSFWGGKLHVASSKFLWQKSPATCHLQPEGKMSDYALCQYNKRGIEAMYGRYMFKLRLGYRS